VGRRVHQQHDEEHDVAGEAAGFGVVYLPRRFRADLGTFDVDEVDVYEGFRSAERWQQTGASNTDSERLCGQL
jgi:hypothetical protein